MIINWDIIFNWYPDRIWLEMSNLELKKKKIIIYDFASVFLNKLNPMRFTVLGIINPNKLWGNVSGKISMGIREIGETFFLSYNSEIAII